MVQYQDAKFCHANISKFRYHLNILNALIKEKSFLFQLQIFLEIWNTDQGCHQLQLETMCCSLMNIWPTLFQSLGHHMYGWRNHSTYQSLAHIIYNLHCQHPWYQPAHLLVSCFIMLFKVHVCVLKILFWT